MIKKTVLNGSQTDVYIEDGRIREVGRIAVEAEEEIDGSDTAVLPGFVNTHTHAAMTVFRGWGDDMELMKWLNDRIWPMEAHLNEEVVYWGTRMACLEMIRTGTTAFADMYYHPKSAAKAVGETGVRGFLGPVFLDKASGRSLKEAGKAAERCVRDMRGKDRGASPLLGPHAIYTCTPEMLEWIAEYSGERSLPVHFHLLETEGEGAELERERGTGVVELLEDIGFLHSGLIAAHCVWADEKDINILAGNEVNVSFNPVSNMKLAVGRVMNVPAMEEKGINICLGTDGPASNNTLSMLDAMKFGALSVKSFYKDPTLCPAERVLDYATVNGAKALSLDYGVEEGKVADLQLIDLKHESMVPSRHSLASRLAYSASPEAIRHVICDGRVVMRGRTVEGAEETVRGFEEAVDEFFERWVGA